MEVGLIVQFIPRSVRLLAVLMTCAGCAAGRPAASTTVCAVGPAQRLIQRLNERDWNKWTVVELRSAFPEFHLSRGGSDSAVRFLEADWAKDTEAACKCCATLAIPVITEAPDEKPHLSMTTIRHADTSFSRALEAARNFVIAAQQSALATRLASMTGDEPFTIDDAREVNGYVWTSTLGMFRQDDGWYWQYQETRMRSPAANP